MQSVGKATMHLMFPPSPKRRTLCRQGRRLKATTNQLSLEKPRRCEAATLGGQSKRNRISVSHFLMMQRFLFNLESIHFWTTCFFCECDLILLSLNFPFQVLRGKPEVISFCACCRELSCKLDFGTSLWC